MALVVLSTLDNADPEMALSQPADSGQFPLRPVKPQICLSVDRRTAYDWEFPYPGPHGTFVMLVITKPAQRAYRPSSMRTS